MFFFVAFFQINNQCYIWKSTKHSMTMPSGDMEPSQQRMEMFPITFSLFVCLFVRLFICVCLCVCVCVCVGMWGPVVPVSAFLSSEWMPVINVWEERDATGQIGLRAPSALAVPRSLRHWRTSPGSSYYYYSYSIFFFCFLNEMLAP